MSDKPKTPNAGMNFKRTATGFDPARDVMQKRVDDECKHPQQPRATSEDWRNPPGLN